MDLDIPGVPVETGFCTPKENPPPADGAVLKPEGAVKRFKMVKPETKPFIL